MEKGKGLVLSDKRFNEDIGYMKSLHIFILFQHDSGIETDHPAIAHDMRFHLTFVIDGHDRFKGLRRNQNLLAAPWANDRYVQHDRGGAGRKLNAWGSWSPALSPSFEKHPFTG